MHEIFAFLILDLKTKSGWNGGNERFFNPVHHFPRRERNRTSKEVLDACTYIYTSMKDVSNVNVWSSKLKMIDIILFIHRYLVN